MKLPGSNEKGMILLLVLLIVALLSSLLMELAFSTLVDMRLTETFRDSTRGYYLAKGGIAAGRMLIMDDQNAYDSRDEQWAQGVIGYPVGEGSVSISIEDLDGHLALNALVNGNNPQTIMVDRFYRLLVALDLGQLGDPAELTAAVIDWLDTGEDNYPLIKTDGLNLPVAGAESDYYQGLANGYSCKNGSFETLDELALVKGFTPEVIRKVAPHVSVNGDVRININTASEEVLMALDQTIDAQTVQSIVSYRQSTPIRTIADIEGILSTEVYSVMKSLANQKLLGTLSSYYRITSEGLVNDGRRRIKAEIYKGSNSQLYFKVD